VHELAIDWIRPIIQPNNVFPVLTRAAKARRAKRLEQLYIEWLTQRQLAVEFEHVDDLMDEEMEYEQALESQQTSASFGVDIPMSTGGTPPTPIVPTCIARENNVLGSPGRLVFTGLNTACRGLEVHVPAEVVFNHSHNSNATHTWIHGDIVAEFIDPDIEENILVVDLGGDDTAFQIPEQHCCIQDLNGTLPKVGVNTRGCKYRTPPHTLRLAVEGGTQENVMQAELEGRTDVQAPKMVRCSKAHIRRNIGNWIEGALDDMHLSSSSQHPRAMSCLPKYFSGNHCFLSDGGSSSEGDIADSEGRDGAETDEEWVAEEFDFADSNSSPEDDLVDADVHENFESELGSFKEWAS
jgi:hypothetical protein